MVLESYVVLIGNGENRMVEKGMLVLFVILSPQRKSWLCGTMELLLIIAALVHMICASWTVHPLVSNMMEQCVIHVDNSLYLV